MKYYVESFLSYLYKKVIVSRAGHDSVCCLCAGDAGAAELDVHCVCCLCAGDAGAAELYDHCVGCLCAGDAGAAELAVQAVSVRRPREHQ